MEYLPAPWRARYVQTQGRESGCVFCSRAREKDDRRSLILHRGEHNFVILNRYPYTPGHVMIAPYKHQRSILEADAPALHEMMDLLQRCMRALSRIYQPQGFNTGMNIGHAGGAGITDHYHMHCLPRWAGDSNFMPLIGETRVFIETLDRTYQRLLAEF